MGKFYWVIISIVVSIIIYFILTKIINSMIKIKIGGIETAKKKTVASLTKNVLKYIIFILEVVILLKIFEFDTSTIVAGIGLMSAVIGLAFQDLLKDLITGIFIIVEDQYRIGEIVFIDSFKGEVIFLGLKSTKLKATNGDIKIIPNGKIINVVNYSREKSDMVVKITTSIENDITTVEKIIDNIMEKLKKHKKIYKCIYSGINKLSGSNMIYTFRIKNNERVQELLEFEINKTIISEFQDEKYELSNIQVDVIFE